MRFHLFRLGEAGVRLAGLYSASLGHRIHRTAFAMELKGIGKEMPLFRYYIK